MSDFLKILISIAAIVLGLLHVFKASVSVDSIAIILFAFAVLPWLLPYIEELEIFGVGKIKLKAVQKALNKIGEGPAKAPVRTGIANSEEAEQNEKQKDYYNKLHRLTAINPSLAIAGFRIDLEERITKLADDEGVSTTHASLQTMIAKLAIKNKISKSNYEGLIEIIALTDLAAKGARVTKKTANWVIEHGPSILSKTGI